MFYFVFYSVFSFFLFDFLLCYLNIFDGIICIVCYFYFRYRISIICGYVLYILFYIEVYCLRKD